MADDMLLPEFLLFPHEVEVMAMDQAQTFEWLRERSTRLDAAEDTITEIRREIAILKDGRCVSCMEPVNPLHPKCACIRAEIEGYRQALERLLPLTDEFEYTLYGTFMGGDPRDFTPDEEMCTPEEISAWETACEEWNRGEGVDRGPGCQTMGDGSAVTGTGFGLGTTIRKCAEREEAKRVLAGKEAQSDRLR